MTNQVRVEQILLDDGRRAERHTAVDASGNEVVEVFAEEKRPLKLEKRVKREMKQVVAKEVHEQVRDGVVVHQEIHSLEPDVPLQIRERIGTADHAKVVDGDYVRKEEIAPMIADGVVAGITAAMERIQPVVATQSHQPTPPVFHAQSAAPIFRAQSVVEQNVEEKKKNDLVMNIAMGVLVVLQAGFLVYLVL